MLRQGRHSGPKVLSAGKPPDLLTLTASWDYRRNTNEVGLDGSCVRLRLFPGMTGWPECKRFRRSTCQYQAIDEL